MKQVENGMKINHHQIEEYQQLRCRIEELPHKLSREILVPFGSVGYMKGRIVQTNKLMVSLGSKYFVECSCYEANQVIDRRIQKLEENLECFEREKEMIQSRIDFGEKIFNRETDEVEIREPYDEQKELEFKMKRNRRKKVPAIPEHFLGTSDEEFVVVAENVDRLECEENKKEESLSVDHERELQQLVIDEEPGKFGVPPKGIDEKEYALLMEKLNRIEREENQENELYSEDNESVLDSDDLPEWEVDERLQESTTGKASTSAVIVKNNEVKSKGKTVSKEGGDETCSSNSGATIFGGQLNSPSTPNEMDNVSPPLFADVKTRRFDYEKKKAKRTQHSVRFSNELECASEDVAICHKDESDKRSEEDSKQSIEMTEKVEDEPKPIRNDEPRFSTSLPRRSILRNSSERSPINAKAVAEAECRDHRPVVATSPEVFTGVVCERLNPNASTSSSKTITAVRQQEARQEQISAQSNCEPSKRISRFKMYRAQLDRPNR
ncbi:unnamed protein product [Anisakis simplex]|uniref:Unconventional prefoldin RPB5 interactor 1 (inferred by orthology to a human protein) n=1 Tax=Anisakis simplex TaxID=6269 RepID=A0A0M3K1R9_ANISI|nr:unnamed protein product [Anisakis simplex]